MNTKQLLKLTGLLVGCLTLFLVACGQSTGPPTTQVDGGSGTAAEAEAAVTEESPEQAAEVAEPVQLDSEGEVPFYARFGENEMFEDDEWAVIVFYRPPSCIPADFNLNQFFHFPGETGPGAFGCAPATMDGVEVWENGPETDPAPLEAEMTGRGEVPVWFVNATELEAEMTDGTITIEELAALPSRLVGTATTYSEFLRPSQSNSAPLIQFTAEGTLEDGTPFDVDVSRGDTETADHVTINLTG